MEKLKLTKEKLNLVFIINDDQTVSLVHFSEQSFNEELLKDKNYKFFQPLELKISGLDNPEERHGPKYSLNSPGYRMTYVTHSDTENELGSIFKLVLWDSQTEIQATLNYQFFNSTSVVKCWTEIENKGNNAKGIEYISSFSIIGIGKEGIIPADEKLKVLLPYNAWQRELNWREHSLKDLGLSNVQKDYRQSSGKIGINNTGNWSSKEYLPMGIIKDTETNSSLFWQIEHNGSWYAEISDMNNYIYLKLSGPTEKESHWWEELLPNEKFTTIPVAVGSISGGFTEAIQDLTRYRRLIRRKNEDNEKLSVIFNDYMNCLFGDPTTEKEIPLIDKAAETGCEYYCIDCGWYSAGYWWDGVGEWKESKERFPNGLREVTDYIRSKNMIPGLWLEIEVVGINSPLVNEVPDNWFFKRHGKRTFDRSRYQLDFRNEEVRNHATGVIERLINDYGIGYIKMDYNVDMGIGTDEFAESPGVGLLEHNRAYLKWLDSIFEKYPDLVIENCSSGGLRMDYALLSRHSVQSTSDQEDYIEYSTISANAASGVTPEQAAVWSYPLEDGSDEEAVFNMVNSIMLRVHQSGHLANLEQSRLEIVKEGIDLYKEIRKDIKKGLPFWPFGPVQYEDGWAVYGFTTQDEKTSYLAVWRRDAQSADISIPLDGKINTRTKVSQVFPKKSHMQADFSVLGTAQKLSVLFERHNTARIFKIEN